MSSADKDRPDQTLADYVAIVLSPFLIMALVGSLVFFLLEVTYSGDYVERMRWILFFFVFGAVLVCRIGMLPDIADRSWLYGIMLGGGTWIGLQGYVEYPHGTAIRTLSPLINLGLIVLVWWCSNKLVWDCTDIDEDMEMSGEGLLQAAGMEQVEDDKGRKEAKPGAEDAKGLIAWWERYQRHVAEKRKKRTLGVWVVYFSLAALPLFGLGQSLIPPSDVGRRRFSFWMLGVYVACGLALLMTTCFLGLRRYLRQRRLKMPTGMTVAWLGFGGALIVLLLAAGALLPRPSSEYPLLDMQALIDGEKSASRFAVKGDSPGKGEGRPGDPSDQTDPNAKTAGNKAGQGKDDGKDKGGGSGKEKGEGGSSQEKGDNQKGAGQDKDKGDGGDKAGKGDDAQSKADKQDPARAKNQTEKDNRSSATGSNKANNADKQDEASKLQSERASALRDMTGNVAKFLKWIVFAVVGVVVAGIVVFAILRFLANFTGWASRLLAAWSRFWESLFGRRGGNEKEEEGTGMRKRARPELPFSSFHNPFRLGQKWSPYEMACYTFAAFEAWARDRGLGRQRGETPLEFAERIGAEVPALEGDARRLALIYARGLYGPAELPFAVNEVLRQVWQSLETGVEHPLSA